MNANTPSFKDIRALVRENIRDMKPYSSARDEYKGDAEIFLDANENPFPSDYNRYPDPTQRHLKEKLALQKQVNPEQIFLGNGSDEAIDLLIRAFCEPNVDTITITEPTYGMYAVCAAVNAVSVKKVLLTPDFDIDLTTLLTVDSNQKLLFLCSPNNPTGNLLSTDKVFTVLRNFPGLVVIDEAYIDFSNRKSFVSELANYPNLVVLQTFSKAWGLAGLRLGMCFADPEIIHILNKIKYPYNINSATQAVALDALTKVRQKEEWVTEIVQQRNHMATELKRLRITQKVFPSDANFLLVRVIDAIKTYEYLMDLGIIVRDRSTVSLCNGCLRITIGTTTENERLLMALRLL